MQTDIEIARSIALKPIKKIADSINLNYKDLEPYGHYIAKVPIEKIDSEKIKNSKLILITAMSPTKAGIGKTTTAIGLALGLNKLKQKATVVLREPSLGVCFGMKGGAAGGGYAQVLPMESINLHFTGDFHAITSAHNMISALLDNHQHQHRHTEKQLKEVVWKRVLDINDRSLRNIVTGLGGTTNGIPAESGFDITPASELMAILCLAESLEDLEDRVNNILLGYTNDRKPFFVKNLSIGGAITALLKDAINPNLVQTTEHTPAIIHGGPFANIAHGANSVVATKIAMSYSDYVVTEAGFGADLGAEKFFNIKCRMSGLQPALSVLVITTQALKMHGHAPDEESKVPNMQALREGLHNMYQHYKNLLKFGQSVVVTLNAFDYDDKKEIEYLKIWFNQQKIPYTVNNSFAQGSNGAKELAKLVKETIEHKPSAPLKFTYDFNDSIEDKIKAVAQEIYGAKEVKFDNKARKMLRRINLMGLNRLPICIAKTQYSFSDVPSAVGLVNDFILHVEDIIINSGAGFIIAKAGSIMRMPGLPKVPQANHIHLKDGKIEGLS